MRQLIATLVSLCMLSCGMTPAFAQSKDQENATIAMSGQTVTFIDRYGSGTLTFAYSIAGAPSAMSISVQGCGDNNNAVCTTLTPISGTAPYTSTASGQQTFLGGYNTYRVTATFSGSATLTVYKIGIQAKLSSPGGAVTANAMQAAVQSQSASCSQSGNLWEPASNTCKPSSGGATLPANASGIASDGSGAGRAQTASDLATVSPVAGLRMGNGAGTADTAATSAQVQNAIGSGVYDVAGAAAAAVGALGTAAQKNVGTAAGNVPVLDSNGLVLASLIPTTLVGNTFHLGTGGQADYNINAPATNQASQDPVLTISGAQTDATVLSNAIGTGAQAGQTAAYGHALGINVTYNRTESNCNTLGQCAFAAVDDRSILLGSHNYNHFGSLQMANMVSIGSGNTLGKLIGLIGVMRQTSGTITNMYGIELGDLQQSGGSVVSQTGIHVMAQTKATGTFTNPNTGIVTANNFGLVVDQSSGGNTLGGNTTVSANYNAEGSLVLNNPNTGNSAWAGMEIWSIDRAHSFKLAAFGQNWSNQTGTWPLYSSSAYFATGMYAGITLNTESTNTSALNAIRFGVANVQRAAINFNGLNLTPLTPSSSTASCTQGDVAIDGTFFYGCTATNIWKSLRWTAFGS